MRAAKENWGSDEDHVCMGMGCRGFTSAEIQAVVQCIDSARAQLVVGAARSVTGSKALFRRRSECFSVTDEHLRCPDADSVGGDPYEGGVDPYEGGGGGTGSPEATVSGSHTDCWSYSWSETMYDNSSDPYGGGGPYGGGSVTIGDSDSMCQTNTDDEFRGPRSGRDRKS